MGLNSIRRAGISNNTLQNAGVRKVDPIEAHQLCGIDASGEWIPYFNFQGEPIKENSKLYGRLRLEIPKNGKKYHQLLGSHVHAYVPLDLNYKDPVSDLYIVEGEFKSIALNEAGFPTIGISGFYGFASKGKLICELNEVIHHLSPSRILFCGDSDTALNYQFSDAALKFANLVEPIPVILPRISLDDPGKGADDCREALGEAFNSWWEGKVAQAVEITSNTTTPTLALELLRREESVLSSLVGKERDFAANRLVKFGAALEYEPLAKSEVITIAQRCLKFGKNDFNRAIKASRNQLAKEHYHNFNSDESNAKINMAVGGLYFDGDKYYRKENDGAYHKLNRDDVKLHLRILGLDDSHILGVSEVELALHRIQRQNRVTYASSFCGRSAGCYDENGNLILARDSPKIIKPATGDPRSLTTFFSNLFGRGSDARWEKQYITFIAWLKRAREALEHPEQHLPGQMLALVGPANCGKTLAQTVITYILGGREADPSLWLQAKTIFNDVLWGAEHLVLSDANIEERYETRKALRDKIKEIVANALYPCHRKYRNELSLRPIWRVSLSANDDAYSTCILPTLDESLSDKVIYLKCYLPPVPFPTEDEKNSKEFFNGLLSAIPAFVHLIGSFSIPESYRKGRFGVREFHHPEIVDILEGLSPDSAISEILINWTDGWTCAESEYTATHLYDELDNFTNGNFRRVSNNPTHLGVQLRRLSKAPAWRGLILSESRRFGKNKQRKTVWIIKNPEFIE